MILKQGILISVEGIDGSGKSTLVNNLLETFLSKKIKTIVTKEPGGSKIGIALRTLLQERPIPIGPKAEFLLFAADRAQHFQEKIIPALEDKNIIISDRMADSSLVYQGYGRGLDLEMLKKVNRWAMQGKKPDLVIYVKITLDIALLRIHQRGEISAFEQERSFLQKLVDGYEAIFNKKDNVITLDGTLSKEQIASHAAEQILLWISNNNLF